MALAVRDKCDEWFYEAGRIAVAHSSPDGCRGAWQGEISSVDRSEARMPGMDCKTVTLAQSLPDADSW